MQQAAPSHHAPYQQYPAAVASTASAPYPSAAPGPYQEPEASYPAAAAAPPMYSDTAYDASTYAAQYGAYSQQQYQMPYAAAATDTAAAQGEFGLFEGIFLHMTRKLRCAIQSPVYRLE